MHKANALFAAIFAGAVIFICPSILRAADAATPATKSAEDPAYTKKIDDRTNKILAKLAIDDPKKLSAAHDIIMNQYRDLNAWHDAHDAELKDLAKKANSKDADESAKAKADTETIKASLKVIHDRYLANLAITLTPEQIETVKDEMALGKVDFTFRAYKEQYPDLTDEQRAHILDMLKEAREIAIDGGSTEEKSAVFTKYKGRINNYLASQGKGGKSKKPTTQSTK